MAKNLYHPVVFKIASFLYNNLFFIYRPLYFAYKSQKDRDQLELFAKWLKPGDVVVDIGANIGSSSIPFSQIVGQTGRVHSFEPEKKNFKYLKLVCRDRSNIILNQAAVSNSNKPVRIFTSTLLNVDHRIYRTDNFSESYPVSAVTLDSYLHTKVSLIKIDVQGAEHEVLLGMQQTFAKNPQVIVFMEYWPVGLNKRGVKIDKLTNLFSKHKLSIYIIRNSRLQALDTEAIKDYQKYKNYDFDNWVITKRPLNKLQFSGSHS